MKKIKEYSTVSDVMDSLIDGKFKNANADKVLLIEVIESLYKTIQDSKDHEEIVKGINKIKDLLDYDYNELFSELVNPAPDDNIDQVKLVKQVKNKLKDTFEVDEPIEPDLLNELVSIIAWCNETETIIEYLASNKFKFIYEWSDSICIINAEKILFNYDLDSIQTLLSTDLVSELEYGYFSSADEILLSEDEYNVSDSKDHMSKALYVNNEVFEV